MESASSLECTPCQSLQAKQVYFMAAICLAFGLGIGYVSRGFESPASAATANVRAVSPAQTTAHAGGAHMPGHTPSLDEMRRLADHEAAPLLAKLKSTPKDSALLMQVGAIYHTTHQFKEAAAWYDRAVQADPKNVALRNKLASSLYRAGDVDGAIAQLNQALTYDSKDANSLFNLGMIRLQGKGDGKGAVAAWQQLLKSNPQLSAQRKAEVQKLMADVLTTMGDRQARKGAAGK